MENNEINVSGKKISIPVKSNWLFIMAIREAKEDINASIHIAALMCSFVTGKWFIIIPMAILTMLQFMYAARISRSYYIGLMERANEKDDSDEEND